LPIGGNLLLIDFRSSSCRIRRRLRSWTSAILTVGGRPPVTLVGDDIWAWPAMRRKAIPLAKYVFLYCNDYIGYQT
jgi:hypothetical protein